MKGLLLNVLAPNLYLSLSVGIDGYEPINCLTPRSDEPFLPHSIVL